MADPVLAKPPSECCIANIIHKGEPRGSLEKIAEVETYVSRPAEGKWNSNVILYFPDVNGLFNNARLVMDGFAAAGYLTLGLDYFLGDAIWNHRKNNVPNPGFKFESWKDKHVASANELVPKWVKAVKEQYGKPETKFACVGYCFGAPYVCDQLAGDVCSSGAFAHPAFLTEHHFVNLKKPLFLSCAEIDMTFPTESRNTAIDILRNNKKHYQLQLFSGVQHGFALKGNVDVPYERYTKEQSLKGMAEFFDLWLSQ